MNSEYTFLNTYEYKFFLEQYEEYAGDNISISSEALKEIVFNYSKFNKT